VVRERTRIAIRGFRWNEWAIEHLAEHDVTPQGVDFIRTHEPLVYRTEPPEFRFATHALVGRDARRRSLIVFISETDDRGTWRVHTAYRARLAHDLLEREGRL